MTKVEFAAVIAAIYRQFRRDYPTHTLSIRRNLPHGDIADVHPMWTILLDGKRIPGGIWPLHLCDEPINNTADLILFAINKIRDELSSRENKKEEFYGDL